MMKKIEIYLFFFQYIFLFLTHSYKYTNFYLLFLFYTFLFFFIIFRLFFVSLTLMGLVWQMNDEKTKYLLVKESFNFCKKKSKFSVCTWMCGKTFFAPHNIEFHRTDRIRRIVLRLWNRKFWPIMLFHRYTFM